ncbi:MAG: hypothetical protein Q9P14_13015, partial [candidate division KSB1 bacterium]|nr:hypothetical protein [candidate division KSB1 bacterium]
SRWLMMTLLTAGVFLFDFFDEHGEIYKNPDWKSSTTYYYGVLQWLLKKDRLNIYKKLAS